jgi:hypothetical protein
MRFVASTAAEFTSGGGSRPADPAATVVQPVAGEATQGRHGGNGNHRDEREEQRVLDQGRSSLTLAEPNTATSPQIP